MADNIKTGDLPSWLKDAEITKLKDAAGKYWQSVSSWMRLPLEQLDPINCHPVVLRLYAYERDVDRFVTEPDSLYRLRVATAVSNTRDAGELVGMEQIVKRFGEVIGGTIERDPDKDWDVITLILENGVLTKDWELGRFIIRQYGRTCRRYEFLLLDMIDSVLVGGAEGGIDTVTSEAPLFVPKFEESVSVPVHISFNSADISRDHIRGFSWL
ncbi:hypothetical protein M3I01_013385 [Marinomonas sp. RSW2]|uniref:Uncharacterized protein n=1 Tax=Marinomonas maritima TaxID=2940935 RepID=A0ABT5WGE2_9GAMM|nr:hypothetical protein [Marinomonas maritima]MDE8603890.1 hypothetical protein [Marinomonas maritima]